VVFNYPGREQKSHDALERSGAQQGPAQTQGGIQLTYTRRMPKALTSCQAVDTLSQLIGATKIPRASSHISAMSVTGSKPRGHRLHVESPAQGFQPLDSLDGSFKMI